LIEVEKVYSWPSPILDRLNNWIKKVQVKWVLNPFLERWSILCMLFSTWMESYWQ
jgi:hypothetical protein